MPKKKLPTKSTLPAKGKKASKKATKKITKTMGKVDTTFAPIMAKPAKEHKVVDQTTKPAVQNPLSNINFDKLFAVVLGLGLIGGFLFVGYKYLPNLKKDAEIAETTKIEANEPKDELPKAEDLAAEAEKLNFENQVFTLQTNFGDLPINMRNDIAPKNTENLIRLASRNYFDGIKFHRMVEQDGFKVLQGGDPKGDGTGGESAFGVEVEDEIFKVAPEFGTREDGETRFISNTPEFKSDLYGALDSTTGSVTYKKGLMIMANKGPNTNSSQFFITLDNTILGPQYTIVGEVQESAFGILDTLTTEVSPIDKDGKEVADGRPNREITIEDVTLSDK
jgi:cyclophilin family peptidyl-prolyl cis-trans isomerase